MLVSSSWVYSEVINLWLFKMYILVFNFSVREERDKPVQFHPFLIQWQFEQLNNVSKRLLDLQLMSEAVISCLKAISLGRLDMKQFTHRLDRFLCHVSCAALLHQVLHTQHIYVKLSTCILFIWLFSAPNLCLCVLPGNTISWVYLISMNVI